MNLNNIKKLVMGLLLANSMEFVYAMESINAKNINDEMFPLKQDLQNTINNKQEIINEETAKIPINTQLKRKNEILSHYEENDLNNSAISNKESSDSNNNEIDNIFENWDYNDSNDKNNKSEVKNKYKNLEDNLIKRTSTQYNAPPLAAIARTNVRKLSDASRSSNRSRFSNPLNISYKNEIKRIDELLNSHNEIIPIITLQSDGLQVLDTIAHLLAFNSFYNLSNFNTSPYIFCASSASILGLSLALDLQRSEDPSINLEKIGNELYNIAKQKNTGYRKKCFNCSSFELIWLSLFGKCIDYDEEDIVDSLYTRISKETANCIITNTLNLTKNSNIEIPNLIIKDVNSNAKIIDQVLQSNDNQDKKSTGNQIKLFTEPIISFIKHFVDYKKESLQKGIDLVENNMKNNNLVRISSKDEENLIQEKNLNDSTVDRLVIILSSNVDNNRQIQQDINSVEINYKELEYEKLKDKVHAIKINLYTANTVMNQNYSLEEKINSVKAILDNSHEFKYLIKNLPQMSSSYSSSESSEDFNISVEK